VVVALPVKLVKYGISGAVGVGYIIGEYIDEKQGWIEPYRRTQDWIPTVGFFVGLGCDVLMPEEGMKEAGEALALSSFPLFLRSVKYGVKKLLAGGGKKKGKKGGWRLKEKKRVEGREPSYAILSY